MVKVRVVEVDIPRKRIGLTMRREQPGEGAAGRTSQKPGGGARPSGKPSDRPPSPKEQATGVLGAALLNALKTR